MAAAYSVFATGGKRVDALCGGRNRNSHGEVIYSHDRDAPPPQQIEPAGKITEMVNMMTQVVEDGTGQARQLDGIIVAGKTGTTNGYQGCLVHRLYRQLRRHGLVRQRRLHADEQHDRRHAAGETWHRDHGLCPSRHRAEALAGRTRPPPSRKRRRRRPLLVRARHRRAIPRRCRTALPTFWPALTPWHAPSPAIGTASRSRDESKIAKLSG